MNHSDLRQIVDAVIVFLLTGIIAYVAKLNNVIVKLEQSLYFIEKALEYLNKRVDNLRNDRDE